MINTTRIKIAILEKNFTVIELAEKLQINVNTISRWINGKNLNSIKKFIEMLEILELDINDIKKR